MTKIYLDIDGVLNANLGFGDNVDIRFDSGLCLEFVLTVSHTLMTYIRNLAHDPRVEVVWCTTWKDLANETWSKLFGLGDLRVLKPSQFSLRSWKLEEVHDDVQDKHEPFIWIDDDAIPERAERYFDLLGVPYLLIRTDPRDGLQQSDLDAIDDFIERYNI